MIARVARDADGADDFAFEHQGNAAFNGHDAFKTKNAQAASTSGEGVLKSLGGALEARGSAGFRDADIGAAELRAVHLLVVDKVSAGVYDGERHVPVVLARFGESRHSGLLGVLKADGSAIGIGHLGKGRKGREREKQRESQLFGQRWHDCPPVRVSRPRRASETVILGRRTGSIIHQAKIEARRFDNGTDRRAGADSKPSGDTSASENS